MTYQSQRILAIAVAIALGMLGAVALGNADVLGLSPRVLAWLSVISTGLGVLQSFLPSVRGGDQKPMAIADRIGELTEAERGDLLAELEHRRVLDSLTDKDAP